jgi:hypothetical protein
VAGDPIITTLTFSWFSKEGGARDRKCSGKDQDHFTTSSPKTRISSGKEIGTQIGFTPFFALESPFPAASHCIALLSSLSAHKPIRQGDRIYKERDEKRLLEDPSCFSILLKREKCRSGAMLLCVVSTRKRKGKRLMRTHSIWITPQPSDDPEPKKNEE